MLKHDFWHLTFTYDLDLQSQSSLGQGRPPCQKSRSNVKRFSQESTNKQTDWQTDGRYQVHYLPRFAVDKYWIICEPLRVMKALLSMCWIKLFSRSIRLRWMSPINMCSSIIWNSIWLNLQFLDILIFGSATGIDSFLIITCFNTAFRECII